MDERGGRSGLLMLLEEWREEKRGGYGSYYPVSGESAEASLDATPMDEEEK